MDTTGLTVIATIPVAKGRSLQLVEEIRTRHDAHVFTVSCDNLMSKRQKCFIKQIKISIEKLNIVKTMN